MRLREALDLCADTHSDDWVRMARSQWGRPATAIVAGLFDPGAEEPATRPLAGHSMALYEPDPRLALVWPVPEDDDHIGRIGRRERGLPEWAEEDDNDWKHATPGWVVVLLNGMPIWQDLLWYLEWGSGIGDYVANIEPEFARDDDDPRARRVGSTTSKWSIALAGLINYLGDAYQWHDFDPTRRLVPEPSPLHPIDAERSRA